MAYAAVCILSNVLMNGNRSVLGDCVDTKSVEACRLWISQGQCDRSPKLMKQYCAKSCGMCDEKREEITNSVTEPATSNQIGKYEDLEVYLSDISHF